MYDTCTIWTETARGLGLAEIMQVTPLQSVLAFTSLSIIRTLGGVKGEGG